MISNVSPRLSIFLFFVLSVCAWPLSAQSPAKDSPEFLQRATELSDIFRSASNKVLPATVKVISRLQTTQERRESEVRIPSLRRQSQRRQPGESSGSGVIIDPRGYVLTNNHVVATARELLIELTDGRRFYGKKFRNDPQTDLAVIWLDLPEGETLPFAKFGDSDAMEIGDWVLAIGSPFDLDATVSAGIISAKGRSVPRVHRSEFLQTDAAINPGNSGGPLINLNGEVIGINTAIASATGANQGIGFALPSNNAKWVAEQILAHDKVVRAWLGVEVVAINPSIARELGTAAGRGVLVEYPIPGSPAEKAGIKEGDVVLSFDGQPITAEYHLRRFSERAELGQPHTMVILRGGKEYRAPVTLVELPPPNPDQETMLGSNVASYTDSELGLLLIQPTTKMLRDLRTGNTPGVVVMVAIPGGRAQRAGVKDSTVIVRVDGKPVPTLRDYVWTREQSSMSNGITLDVISAGVPGTVTIRLGQ